MPVDETPPEPPDSYSDRVAEHIAGDVASAAKGARADVADAAEGARADVASAAAAASEQIQAEAEQVAVELRGDAVVAAGKLQRVMRVLADQMISLAAEMKRLTRYGRRNRLMIRTLVVSVCLEVLLLAGLGALYLRANSNTERSRAACEHSNEQSAKEIGLWEFVVQLSGPSDATVTPEQAAESDRRVRELRAYLNDTFAPQPCAAPQPIVPTSYLAGGAVVVAAGASVSLVLWRRGKRRDRLPADGDPADGEEPAAEGPP